MPSDTSRTCRTAGCSRACGASRPGTGEPLAVVVAVIVAEDGAAGAVAAGSWSDCSKESSRFASSRGVYGRPGRSRPSPACRPASGGCALGRAGRRVDGPAEGEGEGRSEADGEGESETEGEGEDDGGSEADGDAEAEAEGVAGALSDGVAVAGARGLDGGSAEGARGGSAGGAIGVSAEGAAGGSAGGAAAGSAGESTDSPVDGGEGGVVGVSGADGAAAEGLGDLRADPGVQPVSR
ncbi:hypothetical protein [Streptomyces sp. 061-3]|uniref:hypothetical protein n=1 Tax=Streptomyces sp. 061-3 TaxID=2789268 RepID=UPI003980C391